MGTESSILVWQPLLVHLPLVMALIVPIVTRFVRRQVLTDSGDLGKAWPLIFPLLIWFFIFCVLGRFAATAMYDRIAPLISDEALEMLDSWHSYYNYLMGLAGLSAILGGTLLRRRGRDPRTWLIFMAWSLGVAMFSLYLARLGGELWFVQRAMEVGL